MIKIIADSSCCISQEEAKKLDIDIIPLPIDIDNTEYLDGINLSTAEFYEKLKTATNLPMTSQPSPLEFLERFEKIKQDGDSAIVITLSSKISGSYNSACLCKNEIDCPEIEIIDSTTTIGGMGAIVKEAVRLRDTLNVHELADYLNKFKLRSVTYGCIDTLEYLSKGGRLSGTAKFFGTMLNIKPIIQVDEGEIKLIDKKMGSRNGLEHLINLFQKSNYDPTYPVILQHSADPSKTEYVEKRLKELGVTKFEYGEISGIVGTHIGPGACALIFTTKE